MPMALTWAMLLLAAVFEVAGDALIRHGLTNRTALYVVFGFLVLGSYGVVVNLVGLDFSRLIGAYVGWFTAVSIIVGSFVFQSRMTPSLWFGLGLVLAGSFVIQLGARTSVP
jgi:small multidrug resistance family-3 protein